jgi:hypothetical protein
MAPAKSIKLSIYPKSSSEKLKVAKKVLTLFNRFSLSQPAIIKSKEPIIERNMSPIAAGSLINL